METGFRSVCHGFTFNPGLRRLKDYELIKPIASLKDEGAVCVAYYERGFLGAIMRNGFVKHIGNHRKIRYSLDEKEWVKKYIHIKKRVGAAICNVFNI